MDGWDDTQEWEVPENYIPQKKVSIVIAARNEENCIQKCIDSILKNNYPKSLFEIIIVNDHSEDSTAQKVKEYSDSNITLVNLSEVSGKKYALEAGIKQASGEIIACTDANGSKCIAGPINYDCDKSLLQRFQFLDALNNMCVTANGIRKKSYYMANGANLFFSKAVFQEVGGYSNKAKLASGDDMFLIQEIANRYPNNVHFLKSNQATVLTQPESSLQNLKEQRTRWATKSKSYINKKIMRIQGFVFVFVLLILISLISIPIGSRLSLFGFLFALFIKWSMDYLYLSKLSDFFENREPLKSFFGASLGFFGYILFAGWKALRPTKYKWKGRSTY